MLTAVSLFAGIGGIDLALHRAGIHVAAAVEIDPAARGVIADRLPGVTLLTDVTEVTGDQLRAAGFDPRRGVLAAGWPCQGNSVAGRRKGMDDPRSGLWVHVARLLAELHPRWFLGENVPGLYSVNAGRDIAVVRRDLAHLGYWWAERILDAQHFGVPQRRRRVFIVGHLGGNGAAPVQVLLEPESGGGDPAPRRAEGEDVAGTPGSITGGSRTTDLDGHGAYIPFDAAQITSGENRVNPKPGDPAAPLAATGRPMVARKVDVAPALTATDPKRTDRGLRLAAATAVRRLTPLECERLQGFPDRWTSTSSGRPQSDSARYRQLGNAVAVPVVEWIARRIVAAEEVA